MKSRFDVLQSQAARRAMAVFRSSSVAAIALALVVISSLLVTTESSRQSAGGYPSAVEISDDSAQLDQPGPEAALPLAMGGVVTDRAAAGDDSALPADYSADPPTF